MKMHKSAKITLYPDEKKILPFMGVELEFEEMNPSHYVWDGRTKKDEYIDLYIALDYKNKKYKVLWNKGMYSKYHIKKVIDYYMKKFHKYNLENIKARKNAHH